MYWGPVVLAVNCIKRISTEAFIWELGTELKEKNQCFESGSVGSLRIRIRVFLGLPDPLVKGTDPDLDPSIIKHNMKKNLDSYDFVTS